MVSKFFIAFVFNKLASQANSRTLLRQSTSRCCGAVRLASLRLTASRSCVPGRILYAYIRWLHVPIKGVCEAYHALQLLDNNLRLISIGLLCRIIVARILDMSSYISSAEGSLLLLFIGTSTKLYV
jgi:hypothetical protein